MHCREVLPLIDEYTENALPGSVHTLVAEHLSACSACRREATAAQRALSLLVNAPKLPAVDIQRSLNLRIAEVEAARLAWRGRLRTASAFGGIVLACLSGAMLLHSRNVPGSTPPQAQFVQTLPSPLPNSLTKTGGTPPRVTASATVPDELPIIPQPSSAARKATDGKPPRSAAAAENFLDIRDTAGNSARAILSRRVTPPSTVASAKPQPGLYSMPLRKPLPSREPVVILPTLHETMPGANGATHITTEAGYDASGQVSLIRIRADDPPAEGQKN
jgi:hypothetical protein